MAYDCKACGACCTGWEVDVENRDDVPEEMVESLPGSHVGFGTNVMRRKPLDPPREAQDPRLKVSYWGGDCIALKGKIGCGVSCTIYERRPQVCRDFQPGTVQCQEARTRAGLPLNEDG